MQDTFTAGLYVVAGPIGNLGDISLRALAVLREASVIYAEDTRVTSKLLSAHGIQGKPLRSLREAMPTVAFEKAAADVVRQVREGGVVAYLSDAGTPGISDPGNRLVAVLRKQGLPVSPVPGASAVTALLSVAGLPVQRPLFAGFLPKKKGHQTMLKALVHALVSELCDSVVLFESPERLLKLLTEIKSENESICVIIGRELTKKFEETITGSVAEVLGELSKRQGIKGELVLLLHMPYNRESYGE